MNAATIRAFLTRKPFESLQVNLDSGENYQIHDPELAWVVGTRPYVHLPERDCEVICSVSHIATIHPAELPHF